MGLFQQKKPQIGQSVPLYTLGLNKSVLIIGLGNVGKEYDSTRHNIGFTCIDRFAADHDFPGWIEKKDLKCYLTSHVLGNTKVYLVKPTTLMNLSGDAVRAVADFYRLNLADIVVIHDELDIPFGQIRTRTGGSSAGHNGIKSVTSVIGEDYGRIRVGIGPKLHDKQDSADFVLAKFSKDQEVQIGDLTREVVAILTEYIFGGQLASETRSFIV